jgi:glycerophosphoryl diester phosphodiesterase
MAPLIIGHRGDSWDYPENTLAAFRAAVAQGADLVELDVQLSRDGSVLVIHDATLDRTTTGKGSVREKTREEIQGLSAHYPSRFGERYAGERVPTLGEVLGALRGRAGVLVEVKRESVDSSGAVERETVRVIEEAGLADEASIISFVPEVLRRCLDLAPGIKRGHLFREGDLESVKRAAAAARCSFLMPEKRMLNPAFCDGAAAEGWPIVTWVVDDPEELRALSPLGLYGVCTNRPALLLESIWESE